MVSGGDWEKAGWWKIDPGQSAVVYPGDVRFNTHWYAYAHAADGTEWAGDPCFAETVPPRVFQWCDDTSSTDSRTICMHEFLIDGYANHNHHFWP